MDDLYKILGVGADATDDDIRRAYRRRAMIIHPDRNAGLDKGFVALQKAYDVLSDEESRKYYDETGQVKDHHKPEDKIRSELISLFTMLLDTTPDLETTNLVDVGVRQINQNISAIRDEIRKNEKLIKRTKKAKNRMKRKSDKPNLFEALLDERLRNIEININKLNDVIKTHEKIKAELEDYEYSFDVVESGWINFNTATSTCA